MMYNAMMDPYSIMQKVRPVYINTPQQQTQQQNGMSVPTMNPMNFMNMGSSGGASGASGAEGGGMGAMGIGGIIAAAIALQHGLSNSTDTTFEGQKTDDAFAGNMMTEPWLTFLNDQWGWEPTIGEKFDAAVKNQDWGNAFRRSFGAMDYWADPGRYWGYNAMKNQWGDTAANIINPVNGLLDILGG